MSDFLFIFKKKLLKTSKEIKEYIQFKKDPLRYKREQFFLKLIKHYQIKKDRKEFPESIFIFSKEDKCLFEIENSVVWYSFDNVYMKFDEEDFLESIDFKEFIIEMVEKHFKCKVDAAAQIPLNRNYRVEKHFKMIEKYT